MTVWLWTRRAWLRRRKLSFRRRSTCSLSTRKKTPRSLVIDMTTYDWWWSIFCQFSFYPRDAMLAQVTAIATYLSVRLSIRPSVTRWYCVKTKKASVMISSPSGSPKTLVFDSKFHPQILRGSPWAVASNKGGVHRLQLQLMTDRKSHIGFPSTPRSMTLDGLELL